MDTPALYREAVLDHYRNPRNRGELADHTHAADGVNPLCGDSLRIELSCARGRITSMRFSGEACAIATATASMLSEVVRGLEVAKVETLHAPFEQILSGELDAHRSLGSLNALAELHRYPARRKCAELAWATLRAALAGTARVTTETP
ncbi:MAG TPA: SUF system NifU family Fe-S cluster assembly protein [Rhodanobacteraceae bacterium]|nr:SUF system NifU family Fe-S cluster assembly protein [Rhodanobacteraceae bacterium]